ncbi:MAG: nitric-oxide reductase large subunit, partial [Cytophagales bacterium]|nr:nitric-oxide reductase large subunit [Cytophagales bacterium]
MKYAYKSYWLWFGSVIALSFATLLYFGWDIYKTAPPIPEKVTTASGEVLMTKEDIQDGQNTWQSIGGHNLGSIWGHGAYQAPDWSADYLHREAVFLLDRLANEHYGKKYSQLPEAEQQFAETKLQSQIRKNTFDPGTKTLSISEDRAAAFREISKHYTDLFMGHPGKKPLREAYAMMENTIKDPVRMKKMNAFFFWTAWSCVTEKSPGDVSYSNNWPHEPLTGNKPSSSILMWSMFSVVLMIGGILFLSWFHARSEDGEEHAGDLPSKDPMMNQRITPSMRATLKYYWVVAALFILQVSLGAITAHYGVEGQAFFG